MIATIAVFLACFKDRRPFLGPSLADDPAHAATASSGQLASRVDRSDGDHCRGQEHHQDDQGHGGLFHRVEFPMPSKNCSLQEKFRLAVFTDFCVLKMRRPQPGKAEAVVFPPRQGAAAEGGANLAKHFNDA